MQKLSSTKLLPIVSTLLVLILIAKLISLALWWYLPTEGVELNAQNSYGAKYQRVDFKNMLVKTRASTSYSEERRSTALFSINSLILKGLYGNKSTGFAIVAKKSSPSKTAIVSVGEVYEGYKLKRVELTQVIFVKHSKEYVLELSKPNSKSSVNRVGTLQRSSSRDEISEAVVRRSDIQNYSKNPSKIWKDISIAPLKKAGKIVGFKINRIKRGSKMAQLGLKKGDIIIRANNVKLSSSRDAIKLYQNIDKLKTIALVVLRNNQEKEIIYEIH